MSSPLRVEVAVPLPVRRRFTYLWPEGAEAPRAGQRVTVPFGRRRLTGVVLGEAPAGEETGMRLRTVERIVDPVPVLPPAVLELVRFAADYYVVAEGEVLRAALPAGMAAGAGRPAAPPTDQIFCLVSPTADWPEELSTLHRAPAQARAFSALLEAGGRMPRKALVAAGIQAAALRSLVSRGLVQQSLEPQRPQDMKARPELAGGKVTVLTTDQEAATQRLTQAILASESAAFLLHGVTGSGKTEVYLRAAATTLDQGRQVLILVPEIGLTPALAERLGQRFGSLLAVLHSGLTGSQRRAHWDRVRRGEARVVVGARSAIFAPLSKVGLIVVDEEHDTSYKQDETPRYSGRDLALVRGRLERCPVVLASATPSMESYQRTRTGSDQLLSLPRRVGKRSLPPFQVVDLRQEFQEVGQTTLLSRSLVEAMEQVRRDGEQAMLLLNRRGWASFMLCRACGDPISCDQCSVSLTLHRGKGRLVCHYCGQDRAVPVTCPGCSEDALQEMGAGTERMEDELARVLPGLRVLRMDADAVRQAGGHGVILSRFAAGEADVLLGTQMIAKGHDFPGVTLVGILGGDAALAFPDFRAAEWTFQLVAQAAGRAGRGRRGGRVILQAYRADHYAIQHACQHDYEGFYAQEDIFRRALLYPPHAALAAVRVRHKEFDAGERLARRLGEQLRADPDGGGQLRILGPAPAPLARLRGYYRFHLLLKAHRRRRLTTVLRRLADSLEGISLQGGYVAIDVDPMSLM
jgi:primosomal protein N' (replication factor Y)